MPHKANASFCKDPLQHKDPHLQFQAIYLLCPHMSFLHFHIIYVTKIRLSERKSKQVCIFLILSLNINRPPKVVKAFGGRFIVLGRLPLSSWTQA